MSTAYDAPTISAEAKAAHEHPDVDPQDYGALADALQAAHGALRENPPAGATTADVDAYFAARAPAIVQSIVDRLVADRRAYFAGEVARARNIFHAIRFDLSNPQHQQAQELGAKLFAADPEALPPAALRASCEAAVAITDFLYILAGLAGVDTAKPPKKAKQAKQAKKAKQAAAGAPAAAGAAGTSGVTRVRRPSTTSAPVPSAAYFVPTAWSEAVNIGARILALDAARDRKAWYAARLRLNEVYPDLKAYLRLFGNPHTTTPIPLGDDDSGARKLSPEAQKLDAARVTAFIGAFVPPSSESKKGGLAPGYDLHAVKSLHDDWPGDWEDPTAVACWFTTPPVYDRFLAEWETRAAPGAPSRNEALHALLGNGRFVLDDELRLLPPIDYYGGDLTVKLDAAERALATNGGPIREDEIAPSPDDDEAGHERFVVRSALQSQIRTLHGYVVTPEWPDLRESISLSDPAIPDDVLREWILSWSGSIGRNNYRTTDGDQIRLGGGIEDYVHQAGRWAGGSGGRSTSFDITIDEVSTRRGAAVRYGHIADVVRTRDGLAPIVVESLSGTGYTAHPDDGALVPATAFAARNTSVRDSLLAVGLPDEIVAAFKLIGEFSGRIYVPGYTVSYYQSSNTFKLTPGRGITSHHSRNPTLPFIAYNGSSPGNKVRQLAHNLQITGDLLQRSSSGDNYLPWPMYHYAVDKTAIEPDPSNPRAFRRVPGVPRKYAVWTFWWLDEIPASPLDILPDEVTIRPGVRTFPNPFFHPDVGPDMAALKKDRTLVDWKKEMKRQEIVDIVLDHFRTWVDAHEAAQDRIVEGTFRARLAAIPFAPCTETKKLVRRGDPSKGRALAPDEHQNEAVGLVQRAGGGLLSFDVGVGKTLSAILGILAEKQAGRARRPIIVVKKALVPQWLKALQANAGDYRVGIIGVVPTAREPEAERLRLMKATNPITGLPWSPEEIAVQMENAALPRQTQEERLATWKAFRDGAYDLLIVTEPAFERTGVPPQVVQAFVADDAPFRRRVLDESFKPQLRKAWAGVQLQKGQPVQGSLFRAYRRHRKAELIDELVFGKPAAPTKILKALAPFLTPDTRRKAAKVAAAKGVSLPTRLPEEAEDLDLILDADDYAINPDTGGRFRSMAEARAFLAKPPQLDSVWIGGLDEDLDAAPIDPATGMPKEIVAVPVDFLVADEAHAYKGLYKAQSRGYLAGGKIAYLSESGSASARAWKMLVRAAAVRRVANWSPQAPARLWRTPVLSSAMTGAAAAGERAAAIEHALDGPRAGVLFLTATPAKSSPLELFNLLQFVGKSQLKKLGLDDPERFVSQFVNIRAFPLADANSEIRRQSVARDVDRDPQGLNRLLQSVALVRNATDVRRLAGKTVLEGSHGESQASETWLRNAGVDMTSARALVGQRGVYLRVSKGANIGDYTVQDVDAEGRLRLYPPFTHTATRGDDHDSSFPWQLRADAKVPITPPLTKIETDLGAEQAAIYEAAHEAHGYAYTTQGTVGHAIVPNLLALATHPALATFGASGDGLYLNSVDVVPIDLRFAIKGDEDASVSKGDRAKTEGSRFRRMLEACLRPGEMAIAGADPNSLKGTIDPAESPKLVRLATMLVDSMASNVDVARGEVPCGHLVFVQGVEIHAMLLVLLRRMLTAKRDALIIELRGQGVSPSEIDRQTRRLDPRRIGVMNSPIHKGDPNQYQMVADGFNGRYREEHDEYGDIKAVTIERFPAYDVLIANEVGEEGWDLQARTCYVHMLDLPWEPASYIQRIGRAVRQGNLAGRVEVFVHLARGTLDYYRLIRVEGRRGWLSSLLSGGAGASAKLVDGDPESQIQTVLQTIPPKMQAAAEARLRQQFADVVASNRRAAQREALDQVANYERAAKMAFTLGGSVFDARAKEALAAITRIRTREDAPPMPWLRPAIRAIAAGHSVLLPTTNEVAAGLPPIIPGRTYIDKYGDTTTIVAVRGTGSSKDKEVSYVKSFGGLRTATVSTIEGLPFVATGEPFDFADSNVYNDTKVAEIIAAAKPSRPPSDLDDFRRMPAAWQETFYDDFVAGLAKHAALPPYSYADRAYLTAQGDVPLIIDDLPAVLRNVRASMHGREYLGWLAETNGHPILVEFAALLADRRAKRVEAYRARHAKWTLRKAAYDRYVADFGRWTIEHGEWTAAKAAADKAIADAAVAAAAAAKVAPVAAPPPFTDPEPPKPATVAKPGPEPQHPTFADPVWPKPPPKPKVLLPSAENLQRWLDLVGNSWPTITPTVAADVARHYFDANVSPSFFYTTKAWGQIRALQASGQVTVYTESPLTAGIDRAVWHLALDAASRPEVDEVEAAEAAAEAADEAADEAAGGAS